MSLAPIRYEYLLLEVQEVNCVDGHVIPNYLQRRLQSVTELVTFLRVSSAICVYMFAAGRFCALSISTYHKLWGF